MKEETRDQKAMYDYFLSQTYKPSFKSYLQKPGTLKELKEWNKGVDEYEQELQKEKARKN